VAAPVRGSVGALGEFGLIEAITAGLAGGGNVLLGPGDDGALVATSDGRMVVSTDLLVQDRHFRLGAIAARDLGHKAAAVAMADVVAMGATPTAVLIGLALPSHTDVDWVLELSEGLHSECLVAGARVVGGDTTAADLVVLAVTALGDLCGRPPVSRSGARPGDVVAVCGRLGWSAAGFAAQEAGVAAAWPDLMMAHHRPSPPYRAGTQAAVAGATAMIDVSDGLLADLGHIARASAVGIDLHGRELAPEARLTAAAAEFGGDALEWVLAGGEDHALVATFPPTVALPPTWQTIGRVGADPVRVTVDSVLWPGRRGWDHFASVDSAGLAGSAGSAGLAGSAGAAGAAPHDQDQQ
jgi:thiamine-monophosphate kinase